MEYLDIEDRLKPIWLEPEYFKEEDDEKEYIFMTHCSLEYMPKNEALG